VEVGEGRLWGRAGCLALVFVAACARGRPDPVILQLDEQVVRRSDFERHLEGVASRGGTLDAGVRRALFESFVEERLLVLEARARGLCTPDSSAEQERDAVQQLVTVSATPEPVTDAEVEAYYREHGAELRGSESVTLHQILVPTENEARDVRRRLLKDPKSFEVMARSSSRAPEASTGGLMGTFARGQLPPELEAAAFALPAGGLSDVVATPLGFHVLRVDERTPARERSLAECEPEIRTRLTREKTDRAVRAFVEQLLARAKVNHEAAETTTPS